MTNLFETNLQLLSEYDPNLAERLRSHTPSNTVDIAVTPQGKPVLRVRHQDREHLVHSSRDPVREAERWVGEMKLPPVYNMMVFGCGLMYHVYQLVLKTQKSLRHLVIVEKNIDILHAAFTHVDLTPFLRSQTTFFLADPTPSQIRDLMNRLLTSFTLDGLEIIEHPASCQLDRQFYDHVRSIINECLQSGEILLRTKVQLGGLIQENLIRNFPHVLNNPAASALGSLLSHIPAFIVGAGPSLDWNIHHLKHVKESGVIIAVDTVFKKLRNNGIEPHIVVATDPTHLNERHFEGITSLDNSILAFSPSLYPEILKQLSGTMVSLPLAGSKLLRTLKDTIGDPSYLSIGTNAGQTCFNLASYMGCNPIILAGMDLSFPKEGGTTHAADTALRRRITLSQSPGKMIVELIGDQPELEEFDPILVPANQGGEVATNKFWFAYRRSLEEAIHQINARVINCTEGGAVIEGAEVQKLSDAISEFCTRDSSVRSTLQMSIGFFFGSYANEGITVLKESLNILQTGSEQAVLGLQQLDELESLSRQAPSDPNRLTQQMQAITNIHIALVQDQKIYVVLDEAADRVLSPFLKLETRASEDESPLVNAKRMIERYRPYFGGMKDLCDYFSTVIHETLDSMDMPDFSF